tara:strand:+ start:458 stop:919 length:462 start_codon:yes stop_codon:yes gene_type:complete
MKASMSIINRRQAVFCILSTSLAFHIPKVTKASQEKVFSYIEDITSGQKPIDKKISLKLPKVAEDGNQVKISFEVESPMLDDNFVESVYIFADGQRTPKVARFIFTPSMGICSITTKMRLSRSQNVYLLAVFNDGRHAISSSLVEVTNGGCEG